MSSNIYQNSSYLKLLLNTEANQQKILLSSITNDQVNALSEIFNNLFTLPLTPSESRFVKSRNVVIQKLGDINKSQRYRKGQLIKHSRQVLNTLTFFKDKLLDVIAA
jgi:Trp operon repressor